MSEVLLIEYFRTQIKYIEEVTFYFNKIKSRMSRMFFLLIFACPFEMAGVHFLFDLVLTIFKSLYL